MREKEMIGEMRLWALEVLVSNLFAMVCAVEGEPLGAFEKIRGQMIRGAKTQTFPGMGDADSNLLSVELQTAVARLMEMGRTQIHKGVGQKA